MSILNTLLNCALYDELRTHEVPARQGRGSEFLPLLFQEPDMSLRELPSSMTGQRTRLHNNIVSAMVGRRHGRFCNYKQPRKKC